MNSRYFSSFFKKISKLYCVGDDWLINSFGDFLENLYGHFERVDIDTTHMEKK